MAKHEPTMTWMLRSAGKYPNGWIETENDKEILIAYAADQLEFERIICSRSDARLFAKRILACLEATIRAKPRRKGGQT